MGASDWVPSVVGTTASIAVAYLTARGAMKASDGKAAVDRELGSGTLALEVARETRDELKTVRSDLAAATQQVAKLTGYQRRTSRWWDRHLQASTTGSRSRSPARPCASYGSHRTPIRKCGGISRRS